MRGLSQGTSLRKAGPIRQILLSALWQTVATKRHFKYQEMAKRGQYFAHLRDKLNLSPAELDAYLIKNAISDATHEALLVKAEAESQLDLFQAAA